MLYSCTINTTLLLYHYYCTVVVLYSCCFIVTPPKKGHDITPNNNNTTRPLLSPPKNVCVLPAIPSRTTAAGRRVSSVWPSTQGASPKATKRQPPAPGKTCDPPLASPRGPRDPSPPICDARPSPARKPSRRPIGLRGKLRSRTRTGPLGLPRRGWRLAGKEEGRW